MKRNLRIGLRIVGSFLVLAVAEVSAARADVDFSGTFRGPHGQFSIHVGSPSYPVGSYAPYGYRVYPRPRYGYGFDSPVFFCRSHRIRHSHWVPVRHHQRRWLVVERPILVVEEPYYGGDGYYDRGYDGRRYGGSDHWYRDGRYERRYDDRSYRRFDRRHDGRSYRRFDSRHDGRSYRRYDGRYRDDRGWRDDHGRRGKRHKQRRDDDD